MERVEHDQIVYDDWLCMLLALPAEPPKRPFLLSFAAKSITITPRAARPRRLQVRPGKFTVLDQIRLADESTST